MKPTWANLVAAAAKSAGLPEAHVRRSVLHLLRHAFEACRATGRVTLPKFLTLRTRTLKPKKVQHPVTHEVTVVPPRRVIAARVTARWRRLDG